MAGVAFKQVWKSVTGVPVESLADKRYHFGAYNANGNLVVAGENDYVIGVIEEPNGVGEPTQVVAHGFMFIELGEEVAAGKVVKPNAEGKAVASLDNSGVGVLAVGGVAGGIGTILLK